MKSRVSKQKSPHSNRKARILVLQALYEVDSSTHTIQECLTRLLLEKSLSKGTSNFAKQIASGIESFQNPIDELIKKYAPSYPLNQLSPIDRNILRITIYEILLHRIHTHSYKFSTKVPIDINLAVNHKTYRGNYRG